MRQRTLYCLSGFGMVLVGAFLFAEYTGIFHGGRTVLYNKGNNNNQAPSSGSGSKGQLASQQLSSNNDRRGSGLNVQRAVRHGNSSSEPRAVRIRSSYNDIIPETRPIHIDPAVHVNSILANGGKIRNCISGKVLYTDNYKDANAGNLGKYTDLSLSGRSRTEALRDRKASFQSVFRNNVWGGERPPDQSDAIRGSGPGSTLDFSQEVIATLHSLINALKEKLGKDKITLLDIPCGDMAWISRFLETRDDVIYTGMDIVPDIIQHHKRVYGMNGRYRFIAADVLDNNVTIGQYDLILSRMMMQHLFDADVLKLLKKISLSGSKYILMTTFMHLGHNSNLGSTLSYRFRPQNLQLPPYNLTSPVCLQRDGPPQKDDHYLGLWELPLQSVQNCNIHIEHLVDLPGQFFVC